MAKESGMGYSVSVDDSGGTPRDISNDIVSFTMNTPRGVQDVTGIDKSAMERLLLLADGTISLSGVFNDASNMSHDTFKTVPSSSVVRTVTTVHSGQTLAMEMLFSNYDLSRASDGSLVWSSTGQLADGTAPTWA